MFDFSIPDEIIEEIFKYVDVKDFCNVALVCRRFNKVLNSNTLWKYHYESIQLTDIIALIHGEDVQEEESEDFKALYKAYVQDDIKKPGWMPLNWKKEWDKPPSPPGVDPNNPKERDYSFRLIITGDSRVGKSSLLYREVVDAFGDHSRVDFRIKIVGVQRKVAKLQIWDLITLDFSGNASYYRGAQGIIIAFDLTDRQSFINVKQWLMEVDRYARPDVNKLIVGCKADLTEEIVVTYEEAKELADSCGIRYISTSSKCGTNVSVAFAMLVHDVKRRVSRIPIPPPLVSDKPKLKENKCAIM